MAAHIQVVLQEDVENLGKAGELVRVRPGFARNYLLPRKMAATATRGNIDRIEHDKREALLRAAKAKRDAEGIAAGLAELTITLARPAGAEGKLFGSVTIVDIARELNAKGYAIDRKKLVVQDAIRHVGTYELVAKLGYDVNGKFKLQVIAAS